MARPDQGTHNNKAAAPDMAPTASRTRPPLWRRLRALARSDRLSAGIMLFALAIITGLWVVIEAQIVHDRDGRIADAMRENAKLARAFEEHTIRTLSYIDGIVLGLKDRYEAEGAKFDLPAFYRQMRPNPALLRDAVITDAAGQIIMRTLVDPRVSQGPRVSLADREHIKVHLSGQDGARVLISKPMLGRINNQWSVLVTRRANTADGTLAGVVSVAVIPEYFSSFYRDVYRGTGSIVTLVGTDGIVRARLAANSADLGQDISADGGFKRMIASSVEAAAPAVTYIGASAVDGIERVYAARRIHGYPLMVFVGTPSGEVLAKETARARSYRLATSGASVLVGMFALTLVSFSRRRSHAARALRSASDLLERTGAIASVGGWEIDLRSNTVYWSAQTCRIHEVDTPVAPPLEETINFYAPEARPVIEAAMRAGMEQGKAWDLELPLITTRGRRIWVRAQGNAVIEDGKAVRLVGAFQDITERKAAEVALRRSRDRLDYLVSSSPAIIYAARVTGDFGATFVSENVAAQLGYSAEEFTANAGFWATHIHPEDAPRIFANLPGLFENDHHVHEYRFQHKDGSYRWMRDEGRLMKDSAGNPVEMLGFWLDITERKKVEAALRGSEARIAGIVESATEAIISIDEAHRIFMFNAAAVEMFGCAAADAIGQTIEQFMPQAARAGHAQAIRAFAAEPRASRRMGLAAPAAANAVISVQARRADGREFPVDASISHIEVQGQQIFTVILRDLSARLANEAAHASLEAQLRESQKMEAIGTLAGGIAHDFNNIIAAILGNTDLARQDVAAGNPAALQSLDEILKAGRRARDLVQQILSFSRRQPTERKLIALAPIIDESVRLLRATLPARIALEVKCEAGVPNVLADATQIEQVIINLATNAMQAMRSDPGKIGIRLDVQKPDAATLARHAELRNLLQASSGRLVRISVSDSGPGMDEATRARIFEPFFTTKPPGEGTGLGLSVVLGIVQAHEGALLVASEPGMGATFTLYLPVPAASASASAASAAAADADAQPGQSAAAPRQGSGRHILYIDDDEALVFLVKRLLERHGCRVSAFTDQSEALAALRADPASFDLVVTDYNMPGMSGLDVVREARSIRAGMPVAVASGFIDETLRANAQNAGVCELIFKASVVDDLCAAIIRLAGSPPKN